MIVKYTVNTFTMLKEIYKRVSLLNNNKHNHIFLMALFICKYGEIRKNSNFVQLMGLFLPYTVKSTYRSCRGNMS